MAGYISLKYYHVAIRPASDNFDTAEVRHSHVTDFFQLADAHLTLKHFIVVCKILKKCRPTCSQMNDDVTERFGSAIRHISPKQSIRLTQMRSF